MNKLLIDNWNLLEIYDDMCSIKSQKPNIQYQDLLTAVILWDEIFYPCNEMSMGWNASNSALLKVVKPYDDSEQKFYDRAAEIYNQLYKDKKINSIVAQGAIRYQLLSNSLGFDYFPGSKRAAFLREYNYSTNLLRSKIENIIDRSIIDKYEELNRLLGGTVISFNAPLLVDYIIYNTNHQSSYIDYALELKNERSVKKYRDYLSKIEQQILVGNFTTLGHFKNDIDDLINDIMKLDKKHIVSISFSLSVMPSINITKDLKINTRLHLTFLKNLIKFAFKSRKL